VKRIAKDFRAGSGWHRIVGLCACLILVGLWPVGIARAAASASQLLFTLSPDHGPCGTTIIGRGEHYPPGVTVVIRGPYSDTGRLLGDPDPGHDPQTTVADDGTFSLPIVPCTGTTPGANRDGERYILVAQFFGLNGDGAPATFTVASEQCFAATGKCVTSRFLAYWLTHGGVAVNGYPLSDAFSQRLEDGKDYTVQYFERVRMEYHPENSAPYDILLGQFGRRFHPADPPAPQQSGATYFADTGHNVNPDFLAYWEAHGGLAQFGYPLSEEFQEQLEDGQTYTVQYFERARFERHPENQPPDDILLGQFGRRILAEAGR